MNQGAKNKVAILGSAVLNLAEFASKIEEQEIELKIPLAVSGNAAGTSPLLHVSTILRIYYMALTCDEEYAFNLFLSTLMIYFLVLPMSEWKYLFFICIADIS